MDKKILKAILMQDQKEQINPLVEHLDKCIYKAKENPSDALKGFFDKLDKDKNS